MENFIQCLKVAKEAHEGQKRWNGEPYITHPLFIATKFMEEKLKCIAILHDVIEDSSYSRNVLENKGIRKDIIDAVEILTRKESESYKDFILRICKNQEAIKVKIEDIKHNLLDLKGGRRRDKYELALVILESHLPNSPSKL